MIFMEYILVFCLVCVAFFFFIERKKVKEHNERLESTLISLNKEKIRLGALLEERTSDLYYKTENFNKEQNKLIDLISQNELEKINTNKKLENLTEERNRLIDLISQGELDKFTFANSQANKIKEEYEEKLKQASDLYQNQLTDTIKTADDQVRESWVAKIQTINEQNEQRIEELRLQHKKELEDKLEKTRVQTRAVNFGMHAQHSIVPLLAAQEAGISNKEIRWLGDTMDFICFKGLDSDDEEVEIIFADAKTSKSVEEVVQNKPKWQKYKTYSPTKFLNDKQKRIIEAIKKGNINFQIWMADPKGNFYLADLNKDRFI